jgi:pyruvate/2-oxoglutarate dehydrogenase complex dihydrolipoamide dehydrogenase (E3) component
VTSNLDESLQAELPDRDSDFANFEAVDLASEAVAPLDEYNVKLLDNVKPRGWRNPTPKPKYHLVAVGGGAGGLISSAGAAGVGAKSALIESHMLGGDCLNVGCVPSKALIKSAKAISDLQKGQELGFSLSGEPKIIFENVMARMRRLRSSISPVDSAVRYASTLGVDVFLGKGVFTGPDSIEVDGQTLNFARAVIATGGTASIPPIPGLKEAPILTNHNVFNLTQLPNRIAVIGSGPIGLELAQCFKRFGSDVTVFCRSNRIMPKEDPEAATLVQTAMADEGVKFLFNVSYQKVVTATDGNSATVYFLQNGKEQQLESDNILVAAGRKPTVEGIGLEAAGVEYDKATGINVNDKLQTSNPKIFAVGDVATQYQFTHVSDFMARIAIRNALFFGRDKFSDLLIPWATYTDPEVAHVGLYEHDLESRNIPYQTFRKDFDHVDRAILEGTTNGWVKVHVKKGSDQILGATIVGPHAGDMISEISVAMKAGMGLGSLANVIHPYPTSAEAIRHVGDAYNRTRLTSKVRAMLEGMLDLRF